MHVAKVIDGYLYDTETATPIAKGESNDHINTLFITRNRRYFAVAHDPYSKTSHIYNPVDPTEWVSEYCDGLTAVRVLKEYFNLDVKEG